MENECLNLIVRIRFWKEPVGLLMANGKLHDTGFG